jgi:hypothetical protein
LSSSNKLGVNNPPKKLKINNQLKKLVRRVNTSTAKRLGKKKKIRRRKKKNRRRRRRKGKKKRRGSQPANPKTNPRVSTRRGGTAVRYRK